MRLLIVLASLSLLGACNMVITEKPVFGKADSAGAPQLKEGVWAERPDGDCKFDETKPLKSWPDCAKGFIYAHDTAGGWDNKDGKQVWSSVPLLLVAGQPQVMQVYIAEGTAGLGKSPAFYVYAGLKPTKTDANGHITAYDTWLVLCGAPPPKDAKGPDGKDRSGTLTPLPGMTMDKDNNDCTTDSKSAIRGAAAASLPWDTDHNGGHWVRAGSN